VSRNRIGSPPMEEGKPLTGLAGRPSPGDAEPRRCRPDRSRVGELPARPESDEIRRGMLSNSSHPRSSVNLPLVTPDRPGSAPLSALMPAMGRTVAGKSTMIVKDREESICSAAPFRGAGVACDAWKSRAEPSPTESPTAAPPIPLERGGTTQQRVVPMSPWKNVCSVDHRSRNDSGKSQTVRAGSEGWFDLGLLDSSIRVRLP